MIEEYRNKIQFPRLIREKKTVDAMLIIYCSNFHLPTYLLCNDCQAISDYAEQRLIHCPFSYGKPTCVNCVVHCYNQNMKEKIKKVMRFSGPRMLFRHPILTLFHYIDGMRKGNKQYSRAVKLQKSS